MINIGTMIRRGLANKETFYLPGLGTFREEHVPAYFDESEQLFMPPYRALIFVNNELDRDKLTEFIIGNQTLSLTESKRTSSLIVDKFEDCMATKKETYVEGIGNCTFNQNDELVLLPENEKQELSLYDPIAEAEVLLTHDTRLDMAESDHLANDTSQLDEQTPAIPTEPPLASISDNELEDLQQENSSRRWLWPVIGVALCVLIAGIWFLNPIQNATKDSNNGNKQASNLQESGKSSDSISPTANATNQISETETANSAMDSNLPDGSASGGNTDEILRAPSGRYEIIIAAFDTMTEAKDFVGKTNAKGYNVYILQNNRAGNMNKISYASFNTAAEASESLLKVRKELASEAWLWENKNYNINQN